MALNDDLNKAKKAISALRKELSQITNKRAPLFDVNSIDQANDAINMLKSSIKEAHKAAEELDSGFVGISKSLSNIEAEFSKSNSHLNQATKAYRTISSVVGQLKSDQKGYTELSSKELSVLKARNKEAQAEARHHAELLAKEKGIVDINHTILEFRKDLTDEERAMLSALKAGFPEFQKINDALDERIEKSNIFSDSIKNYKAQIQNFMANPLNAVAGIFTFLFKTAMDADKAIGKMGKDLNIGHDAALKLDKRFQNYVHNTQDGYITQGRMTEAMTEMNNEMGTTLNLSDQQLANMSKLNRFSNISFKDQAKMLKTSKALGETYEGYVESMMGTIKAQKFENNLALNAKKIMLDVNNASDRTKISIAGGSEGLAKAAVEAAKLGTNLDGVAGIADSLLNFEQSITNELEAELLTGKDLNLERARGLALNNDFEGVAREINNQLDSAADFGKMNRIQQEAMAKAVGMTADQLGTMLVEQEAIKAVGGDLNDKEKAAYEMAKEKYGAEKAAQMLKEGQLDQLLAEKDLADEKAAAEERFQAALAGLATAFIPFFEMLLQVANVLIPAIAFALEPVRMAINGITGMLSGNVEDLSTMEIIWGSLGAAALVYVGYMKAIKLHKAASLAIEQMQLSLEKGKKIGILGTIGAYTAQLGVQLGIMSAAMATNAAVTFGLGVAVAVAAAAAGYAAIKSLTGDDVFSPGQGEGGYGKRTLLAPEGAIQLNNKDTVIAGTNLFGDDTVSEPGKPTEMAGEGEIKIKSDKGGGNMSSVVSAVGALGAKIDALAARPISVQIDGKEVITATTDQNPNAAGDAVGKNDYQIQ